MAVRDEVKNGELLSEAFRKQRVFPPMYVTTVMAGEKSGSLGDVLERYITYQRLSLAVRKKILLSLLYPSVLIFLVVCLVIFLVTRRSDHATCTAACCRPASGRQILIAIGTTAQLCSVGFRPGRLDVAGSGPAESARERLTTSS
jgi:type IV pilus assembly protein PilC